MNIKTLLALLAGGNLLILVLLAAYRKKYTDEAIRLHFFAQLMMVLSYPFALARQFFPSGALAFLNSAPLIASCYFEALAMLSLTDTLTLAMRKTLRIFLATGLLLYSISVLAFEAAHLRVLVLSFVNVAILVPPTIRVLRVKDGSALRTLLGILFVLMMSAFSFRTIDAMRLGPELVVFGSSMGEIVMMLALYVYLILGGLGVILLAKEKTDARLIRLAHYDEATGALNRDGFIDAMVTAMEKASYDNEAFSMALVDIDGLNEINEINGYAAGNDIIANTFEKLRALVGEGGFIGRLNGDEFMAFVKAMDRARLGGFVADMHRAVTVDPPDGIAYSISIGGAAFEYPAGKDIQFPMVYAACADALKDAKRKGFGEIVIALT